MLKEGEYFYLYNENSSFLLKYQKNMQISSHKGLIKIEEGAKFGDRILSNKGEAFYIIRPVTTDFMMKVKRLSTIIYPKEAAMFILELGIVAGSKVIEIGTGSGALTILLSQIVGNDGKIYTYEKKESHLEIAQKNFKNFGRFDNVIFNLRDPLENDQGFGIENVDSVIIDVPEPWKIIPYAHTSLKAGGTVGILSPNIEQIQTNAETLRKVGFTRIRTQEVLQRWIRVQKNLTRPYERMIGHSAYIMFAHKINEPQPEEEFYTKKKKHKEIVNMDISINNETIIKN